ncbi:hypothetical protein GH714_016215 [Hevea brasiliensis]|uniref:Senescence domain-containing protein n=1 Tax=Hevea brasiliensis TaxID=3981 RepID=A0A6A6LXU4_HEVBR|nr:hypothetical protein GH714_016215 [Hevea brasiliensis]
MASQNPNPKKSLYPEVILSNPDSPSHLHSNPNLQSPSSNLYPTIDMRDLVENLFPDPEEYNHHTPSAPPEAMEEVLITIPGAVLNLIDKNYSVELACGDLSIFRLRQGDNIVAVLARVADEIQWPLAKDEAAVKLDDSHYFFSLRLPKEHQDSDSSSDEEDKKSINKNSSDSNDILNYGLTIASKGQEALLKEFDGILQAYSCFTIQKVSENAKAKGDALLSELTVKETSPADLQNEDKKELMEGRCAAYWTTLAPNVEDYSSTTAKVIATGSGHLIKGILWCGDVTVDRMKWGNEVMKRRMSFKSKSEISPDTMKRIRRCENRSNLELTFALALFYLLSFVD